MKKDQIQQYFKLAPIVRRLLDSNAELDPVEQMIVAGYFDLEKEYLKFYNSVNNMSTTC